MAAALGQFDQAIQLFNKSCMCFGEMITWLEELKH